MIWVNISVHIPKGPRYTLGTRIENKLLDLLELARLAYFTKKEDMPLKIERIGKCIFILDSIKFLITISWEAKFISHKHYEEIAVKTDEVGRILGGWQNGLANPNKKNRAL